MKFRICIRHRENFWAFTGPKMDFGMILLILNMIIQRNFTGPTHFLSANVLGPVSLAVSDACLMFRPWITSLHEIFTILIQHYTCNVDFLKARSQGISRHGTGTCIDLKAGIFISQHHHDQKRERERERERLSLSAFLRTEDIGVHIVHISRLIITYTLE